MPVSTTVNGTVGGQLTSSNGGVQLDIPGGALTGNVTFTHAPALTPEPSGDPGVSRSRVLFSFELSAEALGGGPPTFSQPLTLTVRYHVADLNGMDERTIQVVNRTRNKVLPTTVDTVNHVATAPVTEFSTFDLVVQPNRSYLPVVLRNSLHSGW
jgi:hypothetical protein